MKLTLLALLSLYLLILSGCSSLNPPNGLLHQATLSLDKFEDTSNTDLFVASKAGRSALDKLDLILTNYPSSEIALRMTQGQPLHRQHSLPEIRDRVTKSAIAVTAAETPQSMYYFMMTRLAHDRPWPPEYLWFTGSDLVKAGLSNEVMAISQKILDAAQNSQKTEMDDPLWCASTLRASVLAWVGNTQQALATAERIDGRSLALAYIAKALAMTGDMKQSLAVTDKITDGDGLMNFVEELMRSMPTKHAQNVFSLALVLADKIHNDHLRTMALEYVADKLTSVGDVNQAIVVASRMADDSTKCRVLNGIARKLAEQGDTKHAKELCQQSLAMTDKMKDDRYKCYHLNNIARTFAETGDMKQAQKVCRQVLTMAYGIKKDKPFFGWVAETFARAGDAKQAIALVTQLENSAEKARELGMIAIALKQSGDPGKASVLLEQSRVTALQISNSVEKAGVLGEVAGALAKAGETDQAQTFLKQAFAVVDQIVESGKKWEALDRIRGNLTDQVNRKSALQAMKRMYSLFTQSGMSKDAAEEENQLLQIMSGLCVSELYEKEYGLSYLRLHASFTEDEKLLAAEIAFHLLQKPE